jgi:hypothetical protein
MGQARPQHHQDDEPHQWGGGGYRWLAGDHHVHTRYSHDGVYPVIDHVRHARAYGLDWMVITDHGSGPHARIGVEKVNPDIRAARDAVPDILIFQGLEWNIPAAEHGTVFVHPGEGEVAVLKEFEKAFDGVVTDATASTPANEALAVAGVDFLAAAVDQDRVRDALFLANHPARNGIDAPHEIRAWRDAQPRIAVGFEGAPGHQAAGIPAPGGPGGGRGYYDGGPGPDSFPGYPPESYRTWGGFDWMTATVGGLWDSLLAEGRPWWITANSDSHRVHLDSAEQGPDSDYNTDGFFTAPVYRGRHLTWYADFWPGFYSRTHVGCTNVSYAAVMAGLRAGRIWVDHGNLLRGLAAWVVSGDDRVPLGGTIVASRRQPTRLVLDLDLATTPNWGRFVPRLAKVDVIRGAVTGPVTDRDVFTTPDTRVVRTFDTSTSSGSVRITYDLGPVDEPCYLRLRGSDGRRSAPGHLGAAVDPAGPAIDVPGNADPWVDLWFYTNPIWVLPAK